MISIALFFCGVSCQSLVPCDRHVHRLAHGTFLSTPSRSGVWAYEYGEYNSLVIVRRTHRVMNDMLYSENSNTDTGSRTPLTDAAEKALSDKGPTRIDLLRF